MNSPWAYDYDWQAAAEAVRASGLSIRQFWEQRAGEFSRDGNVPAYSTMVMRIKAFLEHPTHSAPSQEKQGSKSNLRVVDLTTTKAHPNFRPANVRLLPAKPAPFRVLRLSLPNGAVMELQPEHPDELALKILDRVWGVQ